MTDHCIDREFYGRMDPGAGFEEARAILIGKYVEKELSPEMEDLLKQHLDRCGCCTQFLNDLDKPGEIVMKADTRVPYAFCPSSEMLDAFHFHKSELPRAEGERIERHLQECPLCKEELQWLQSLETEKLVEFNRSQRSWLHSLSAVAAVFFFLLSSVLVWQRYHVGPPEEQLRALAHIKEPYQINYASLDQTSASLPPEMEQIYNEGVIAFKHMDFHRAAAAFERLLDENPQHAASVFLLGYCYYKLNEPEKAFKLCDRAEGIHPHAYERCMSLVNIALKTGHYGRALEEITSLYHEAPNVPEIRDMYFKISSLTQGRTLKM